ncbi:MAG: YdeI/OmpD-associated family protein [Bacteroidota bacterium]
MISTENFKKVEVTSPSALRDWLEQNFTQEESVWLVTYKKDNPDKYVSVSQVLDELISFGWIDGIRRKLDNERTMQLISPRKTQHWAKTYKDRAEKLIKIGQMHAAGLLAIEVSKKNGLWNFMDDVDQLIIPPDLQQALHNYPEAASFFEGINASSKRFVLRWIKLAKTKKTRTKRIEQTALLASRGEKVPGS